MSILDKIFKKEETGKSKNYLTGKEVRAIARENAKIVSKLEKEKKRKLPQSAYTTQLKDENNILEVDNLNSYFFTDQGVVKAVNGVSFNIPLNSTVGVVGESGCGKSVTSMSIMRLLQGPSGQIVEGEIRFKVSDYKRDEKGNFIPVYKKDEDGNIVTEQVFNKNGTPKLDKDGNPVYQPVQELNEDGIGVFEQEETVFDIAKMPIDEMYRLRGRQMAMVFQEPMTSLNPVFTIGDQLDEVSLLHVPGANKEFAKKRSIDMLNLVGIAMPERVYASYPHELSGGMRQRVMIAMALAGEPRLIIADEPTTALDVTIQAQILDLFNDLKRKINSSILLITHDLGVIAEMADYVVVMYAGRIIEQGTVSEIFHNPMHPYTQGLQKSKPTMKTNEEKLFNIPGNVPNPIDMPNHCYFKERCKQCIGKCSGEYPGMVQVSPTHYVACHLYEAKEG
jgi:peptide/nickel transport system ATP-binding protein